MSKSGFSVIYDTDSVIYKDLFTKQKLDGMSRRSDVSCLFSDLFSGLWLMVKREKSVMRREREKTGYLNECSDNAGFIPTDTIQRPDL